MDTNAQYEMLKKKHCLTEEQCNWQISDSDLEFFSYGRHGWWGQLPPHLGFSTSDGTPESELLFKWKDAKGPGTTYKKLILALLEIGCPDDAETVCTMLYARVIRGN